MKKVFNRGFKSVTLYAKLLGLELMTPQSSLAVMHCSEGLRLPGLPSQVLLLLWTYRVHWAEPYPVVGSGFCPSHFLTDNVAVL